MSESKHTPGPWQVQHNDSHRSWCVVSACGDGVTGWARVCQSEADARLIAAAPDLLEACRAIANCEFMVSRAAGEKVLAAIAKAEGHDR